jgi:hypothetical protein
MIREFSSSNTTMSNKSLLVFFGAALSAGLLHAATITTHNTGVNGSDVVQPIGAATSFWTLLSKPTGATETLGTTPFRYHHPAYYADTTASGWVSPGSDGNAGAGGNYVYELTIDLTALNPATAVIGGLFGTDNDGSISLNGNAPVATTCFACFGAATSFTFSSGFVAGINHIDVKFNNGGDPTAFNVDFLSAAADPVGGAGCLNPRFFP